MSRLFKEDFVRHVSTDGNLGFVPTGTNLFTLRKKGHSFRKTYNVAPNQLVMWTGDLDCATPPTTVAPADLTVDILNDLHIGVGYDSNLDGTADMIREISPTALQACNTIDLDVASPTCSVPQLEAVFPSCLACETTSLLVRLYDSNSIAFGQNAVKSYQERLISYTPDCETCDGCDRPVTCDEVVCGLLDQLTNYHKLDDKGRPYPHSSLDYGVEWEGVDFFKIHPQWHSYCLAPTALDNCTTCNSIAAIDSFTINGTVFPVDITAPSDDTKLLVTQLQSVVDQINETFESELGRHSGKAMLARGQGNCCPLQLFVTTCDENFVITSGEAPLEECEDVINQFPDFVTAPTCAECGSEGTTETPNCGIGAIAYQDFEDCDNCDITQPRQFWGRQVELDIISPSGSHNPKWNRTATLLKPQLPGNFGSQIQYLEYSQASGGPAFNFEIGNPRSGWLGTFNKDSRLKRAVRAKCEYSYCSYLFKFKFVEDQGITRSPSYLHLSGYIHVPQGHDTTKTDVEALQAKLIELDPQVCRTLSSSTCD